MSKARRQSSKRKTMRILYGSQNDVSHGSKKPGMRLQIIKDFGPKKKGRKSNRRKWLEKLPIHIGKIKFIYHKLK